jgi:hypothetical protein
MADTRRRGRPPSGNRTYTIPLPPDLVETAKRVASKRRERGERCVYGDLVREGLAMRLAAVADEERPRLFDERRVRVLPNLALVLCPPIGFRVRVALSGVVAPFGDYDAGAYDEDYAERWVGNGSASPVLQRDQGNPP